MTAQWIVTGCRGQLGRALTSLLESRGIAPLAVSHAELDIADAGAVGAFFAERVSGGGTMLNAAAFTHVVTDRQQAARGIVKKFKIHRRQFTTTIHQVINDLDSLYCALVS